jgi:hypothetical protein
MRGHLTKEPEREVKLAAFRSRRGIGGGPLEQAG